MNANNKSNYDDAEKLKEIPKWTRRYAQNRTLTILVLILMTILIGAVVTIPISCLMIAFLKRSIILGVIGAVLFVIVSIFYVKFLLKFGGKNRGLIDKYVDQWIYGKEGNASVSNPTITKKLKWLELIVSIVSFLGLMMTMFLGINNYIAVKYTLPLAALFSVPSLVFQYFIRRPNQGPLLLICPILYTIHAILVVAGVPIFFTGKFGVFWNISFPLLGYNFLAYVISHLYSRYALQQLKNIANLQENNNEC